MASSLRKALEEKERQLSWIDNVAKLGNRFHNLFKLEDILVAEISFGSQGGEYRGLGIVLPDKEAVVYYTMVPKKGSVQQRRLKIMKDRSDKILSLVRQRVGQDSS